MWSLGYMTDSNGITVGLEIGCSWAWPMKMNASGCLKGILFQFLWGWIHHLKCWSWKGDHGLETYVHTSVSVTNKYTDCCPWVCWRTHTHTRTWNIIHHKLHLISQHNSQLHCTRRVFVGSVLLWPVLGLWVCVKALLCISSLCKSPSVYKLFCV